MFAKSSNHAPEETAEAKEWKGTLPRDKSTGEAVFVRPAVVAAPREEGTSATSQGGYLLLQSSTTAGFREYLDAGLVQQLQVAVRPPGVTPSPMRSVWGNRKELWWRVSAGSG